MTAVYCSVDDVISLLRLYDPSTAARWADSTTSDPTTAEFTDWIEMAQDYIDKATGHSWTTLTITDEYHDCNYLWTGFYQRELPVRLNHRSVKTFNHSVSNDHIDVWDGTNWVNYAADYTEGRANDFWVDYTNGIIYFCNHKPWYMERGVKVTYRYGESSVPSDIQEAAAKLAAIKFIESDWYKISIPEGGGVESGKTWLPVRWREDVDKIIKNRRETKLIGFM